MHHWLFKKRRLTALESKIVCLVRKVLLSKGSGQNLMYTNYIKHFVYFGVATHYKWWNDVEIESLTGAFSHSLCLL